MKIVTINRRQFLLGSAGSLLTLPLLPSLGGIANAAGATAPRRVIFVCSGYGIPGPTMFGPDSMNKVGDWIHAKPLTEFPNEIGGILKASFNGVRDKVTMIRGLDVPGESCHNTTAFTCAQVVEDHAPPTLPSVDVILENSPRVYPAGSTNLKVLRLNGWFGNQPGYGDPTNTWSWRKNSKGQYEKTPFLNNDQAALQAVMGYTQMPSASPTPVTGPNMKAENSFIMDRVLDSFNSLLGSKRLSNDDRLRLQDHAQRVHEIQTGLVGAPTPTPTPSGGMVNCSPLSFAKYTSDQPVSRLYNNYFKCIATAMACAGTRVAMVFVTHPEDTYFIKHDGSMSYHHLRSHEMDVRNPNNVPAYLDYTSFIAARVADLANTLNNTMEADGTRMLDNSLIVWGNELGEAPGAHRNITHGLITVGSLQGTVRTGTYLDYRQRDKPLMQTYAGHPMNSFLVGLMDRMGMDSSEYMNLGDPGGFGGWRTNGPGQGFDIMKDALMKYQSLRNVALPYYYL